MFQKLISITVLLMTLSCSGAEKITSDTYSPRIYFGKSGGFTNIPIEYVLIGKGNLFRVEKDSLVKIKKITSAELKNLETRIENAGIRQSDLHETGNITYHITIVEKGTEKTITWSDSTPDDKIEEFYKTLMAIVKE
jgi:hypothetical protein